MVAALVEAFGTLRLRSFSRGRLKDSLHSLQLHLKVRERNLAAVEWYCPVISEWNIISYRIISWISYHIIMYCYILLHKCTRCRWYANNIYWSCRFCTWHGGLLFDFAGLCYFSSTRRGNNSHPESLQSRGVRRSTTWGRRERQAKMDSHLTETSHLLERRDDKGRPTTLRFWEDI